MFNIILQDSLRDVYAIKEQWLAVLITESGYRREASWCRLPFNCNLMVFTFIVDNMGVFEI